jgi:hypothetical protein
MEAGRSLKLRNVSSLSARTRVPRLPRTLRKSSGLRMARAEALHRRHIDDDVG